MTSISPQFSPALRGRRRRREAGSHQTPGDDAHPRRSASPSPGGRAHPEDSGPVDTALREAHEEVGIEPDRVEVLGFLPPIDTVEFKPWVVPVVGRGQPGEPRSQ